MADRNFSIGHLPGFATIAAITFVFLYLPIATLVVYSFNEAASMARWEGFSLRWYAAALANEQVQDVSLRSLLIAVWAASLATILATMAALATTRTSRFPGQTMIYALINQPLMVQLYEPRNDREVREGNRHRRDGDRL